MAWGERGLLQQARRGHEAGVGALRGEERAQTPEPSS